MSKISPKNIAEAIYETTIDKSGVLLAETLRRGVKLIHNKRMLGKSDEILKALQNISDKKTGTIRMKVTTANNLRPEEKKRIENEVKEKYKGKSIVSEFFEKEELLGGMRVEVGDEVLDTSYRSGLRKLESFLKQKNLTDEQLVSYYDKPHCRKFKKRDREFFTPIESRKGGSSAGSFRWDCQSFRSL